MSFASKVNFATTQLESELEGLESIYQKLVNTNEPITSSERAELMAGLAVLNAWTGIIRREVDDYVNQNIAKKAFATLRK